jgi:hypothetical protein
MNLVQKNMCSTKNSENDRVMGVGQ